MNLQKNMIWTDKLWNRFGETRPNIRDQDIPQSLLLCLFET